VYRKRSYLEQFAGLPGGCPSVSSAPVRVTTVRPMAVSGPGERADRGLPTLVIAGACLLAAAPLLNLAVRVLAGLALAWSGDQALVELGARGGLRTLLVDVDAQAHATFLVCRGPLRRQL